jgi:hypothetical protein
MRLSRPLITALLITDCSSLSQASEADSIASILRQPIIDTNLPLAEIQAYTESRIPVMPTVTNAAEWTVIAKKMREETLEKVVFRGEAAQWRKQKTRVEWLDTIPGGPGYHIRKLRYEAVPGLWIPAVLYVPDKLTGKVPVSLAVNGHEGTGKAVAYKQVRCINMVKRGMLVLNPEWFGMGQLKGSNYLHYRMNQLDLCGTSGLAPFYLAMSRGLDILLEHEHADPHRVVVSGLSGGGWQTIFISSLDERVTFANPVAGYSSFRTRARFVSDLGDSEQTPCDLASVTDYAHLTAMRAPRPTLLTFNATDNCCFASPHAMPPLVEAAAPIFKLYGREVALRTHVNRVPGDHNYGLENREAFYRMLADFIVTNAPNTEIASDAEIKTYEQLAVPLPEDNADFNSLARQLARNLPRAVDPASNPRARLREILRAKHSRATAERVTRTTVGDTAATSWRIRVDDQWTVPAVELTPKQPAGTTLLVADTGRASVANQVEELLKSGQRVLAVDPFYFGESKIRTHDFLYALLLAASGDRPLGLQASQLTAIAQWARARFDGDLALRAIGFRTSLAVLVAAALETHAIQSVEYSTSLTSLKQIIENNGSVDKAPELFCFGLLEHFDIPQLQALVAPRALKLSGGPNDRAVLNVAAHEHLR